MTVGYNAGERAVLSACVGCRVVIAIRGCGNNCHDVGAVACSTVCDGGVQVSYIGWQWQKGIRDLRSEI